MGDYFDNDEDEFGLEHNVLERVAPEDELGVSDIEYHIDPYQRFSTFIKAIALSLDQHNFISINHRQIQEMIFKAQLLSFPEYKNPTAYVIGYYILGNDKTISKERLNRVIPYFEKFEYPIRPTDAVRYANLWINELIE